MDARRLELYDLLKPKLGEEPARRLVVALADEPHELALKSDLRDLDRALKSDLRELGRASKSDLREAEARIVDKLTWRMITVMGAWTITATSLFAWMSQLF